MKHLPPTKRPCSSDDMAFCGDNSPEVTASFKTRSCPEEFAPSTRECQSTIRGSALIGPFGSDPKPAYRADPTSNMAFFAKTDQIH